MSDYQNLMLSKPQAEEFFRIDPVSIVGWNDVTRRLFDPDGELEEQDNLWKEIEKAERGSE